SAPLAVALGSLALASVGVAIGSSVHARTHPAPTGSPQDGRRRARRRARRVDGCTSARIRRAAAALAVAAGVTAMLLGAAAVREPSRHPVALESAART
ncbi:ComEC/Rec2 family competence protein, partial [Clavibacter michiganensis]